MDEVTSQMPLLVFLVIGTIAVASSILVVAMRNPVHSALFLLLTFLCVAVLFVLRSAEFVAAVQVLVYAGGIMVLFLFVVMYLNLKHDVETGVQIAVRRGVGWLLAITVGALAVAMFQRHWAAGPVTAVAETVHGNTEAIGRLLYSKYLFPFELTSIILLAAMIGVIVIGKGRQGGVIE
jgi:NADH-quinone oxidoreductase subunit J